MRKIALGKDEQGFDRLFLNNEPLFQSGRSTRAGGPTASTPRRPTPPSGTTSRSIKALGMNMLRKHVKVEPDRCYYWCDKLGLLVWQDMPSARCFKRDAVAADALAARDAQFECELEGRSSTPAATTRRSSCGCRSTRAGASTTRSGSRPGRRAYDPTRLVDNASGWTDEASATSATSTAIPGRRCRRSRRSGPPSWASSAASGLPLTGHLWQAEGNWGYRNFDDTRVYESRYADLIKNLYPLVDKGLAAAVYTQTSDCEVEVNGLMTYDREVVKLDPARFSTLNRGFLPPRFVADQTLFVGPSFLVELAGCGRERRSASRSTAPSRDPRRLSTTSPSSSRGKRPSRPAPSGPTESRAWSRAGRSSRPSPSPRRRPLPREGPGLRVFEGRFEKLPDFAALTASRTGTAARPDVAVAADKDEFALRFRGYVRAPDRRLCFLPRLGRRQQAFGRRRKEIIVNDGVHGLAGGEGRDRPRGRLAPDRDRLFPGDGRHGAGALLARAGIPQEPGPGFVLRPMRA